MDRLADDGSRLPQRGHHDQRCQLAEVLTRARDALVEALVAETMLPQVARVRHRDRAVGYLPAVDALPQRLAHGVLDGAEERERHGAELRLEPELHAGAGSGRLDAEPDRGEERVGRLVQPLDSGTGADGPFDADRRRLAEADLDAEVGRQRGPDDLLLDLAVERDVDLPADVVLPDVDQWVLLGEPGERDPEGTAIVRIAGHDDRLQGRRGEPVLLPLLARRADRVADLDLREAPQLRDLSGGH